MNKQEFQQKIKDMKPPKFFTAITLGEAYEAGFEEAKGDALYNSCFLNEPKKPTVPQYVADLYESIKDDFEYKVYELCLQYKHRGDELPQGVAWWFGDSRNKPIETLVMMHKFGYEVEKEKLYEVFLKRNGAQLGVCVPHGEDKTQFTKVELQEYDFDNLDVYEVEEVEE